MAASPDGHPTKGPRGAHARARAARPPHGPTEHDYPLGKHVLGRALAMQLPLCGCEVGHSRRPEVGPPPGEQVPLRAAPSTQQESALACPRGLRDATHQPLRRAGRTARPDTARATTARQPAWRRNLPEQRERRSPLALGANPRPIGLAARPRRGPELQAEEAHQSVSGGGRAGPECSRALGPIPHEEPSPPPTDTIGRSTMGRRSSGSAMPAKCGGHSCGHRRLRNASPQPPALCASTQAARSGTARRSAPAPPRCFATPRSTPPGLAQCRGCRSSRPCHA